MRRGENIRKRKDGRWEARYKVRLGEEAKTCSVYGKTYIEAKRKRQAALLEQEKFYSGHKPQNQSTTFAEVAQEWLRTCRIRVKQSSFARYEKLVGMHLLPHLGNVQIRKITVRLINSMLAQKQEEGRLDGKGGLSAKTVRDIASVLRNIMQYAYREGYIPHQCCEYALPLLAQKEMRVLSTYEQQKLEKYLQEKEVADNGNLGILLCLHSGLRIGELCALKWSDIDLNEGILRVRHTMQRISVNDGKQKTEVVINTPKTRNSVRNIPLSAAILAKLRACEKQHSNSFFLTGTEKHIEPRTMQLRFGRCLKNIGLPHANFHAIRHTFATRCIEAGFDVKSLSEILGHASVAFTLNRYVHSSMEHKRAQMDKLALSA